MSNNMTPISIPVREKGTYFICNHYKLIEYFKIEDGTSLNESVDTIDPKGYRLAKNGEGAFETLGSSQIHT